MKLDYFPEGSELCPFLRLFDFTTQEAQALLNSVERLAAGDSNLIALHTLPFVEPCEVALTLRLQTDSLGIQTNSLGIQTDSLGILQVQDRVFACNLSASGWSNVAGLIEPFALAARNGSFQWLIGGLNSDDSPSLLLSPDGQW